MARKIGDDAVVSLTRAVFWNSKQLEMSAALPPMNNAPPCGVEPHARTKSGRIASMFKRNDRYYLIFGAIQSQVRIVQRQLNRVFYEGAISDVDGAAHISRV